MMSFAHYYAALLRGGRDTEPRADEALRDYQAMLNLIQAGNLGV